jgi:hypothetical protein
MTSYAHRSASTAIVGAIAGLLGGSMAAVAQAAVDTENRYSRDPKVPQRSSWDTAPRPHEDSFPRLIRRSGTEKGV